MGGDGPDGDLLDVGGESLAEFPGEESVESVARAGEHGEHSSIGVFSYYEQELERECRIGECMFSDDEH